MGELIRSHDWRHSELGPPEQWPAALKSAISNVLNSGTAMHISWGDNLLQFYNDAYTPVLTDGKHPAALGRSVSESFPEIWGFIRPLFDRVLNKGEAVAMENAGLMMHRDGVLKESFFSFSYSPLKSLSGEVCGVTSVCWETTEEVITKQRERGLRQLIEQLTAATTLADLRHVVSCYVEGNRADLPFLLWYERDEVLKTLHLVESCGISPDAPLIRELCEQDARPKLGPALDSGAPVARLLSLPEPVTDWLVDPPPAMIVDDIAIEPLCYVNYSTPDAYVVFGVGVHRPFDGACKNFHESICRSIERAVRRISAVEFERREGLRQFESVMHLTLDAARIGYWDLDLLTYTPKQSLLHDRIFGYDEPLADWSYERFLEHVLPQDRDNVDRLFKTGLDAKEKWDIECRIIRRDGALRWIWIHGDVLTNATGDAVRTLGIIIDVTERKHMEEAMRASEEEFRALAEAMPQIVWITRPDGWNTYINQQWTEYTGLTLAESLGHGWDRPFHPEDRGQAVEAWENARSTVGTYSIESRLRRADGVYRWWLIRGVSVRDATGQAIKWFGTCTDIHDLKVAELEINRVNQGLRESEIRMKRLNRVYAVLSQINALIVRKPGRDELLREACRVAVELGELRFASIALVDRVANLLTPVASAGEVLDLIDRTPRAVLEIKPGAVSRAAQALRERKPQVVNDFNEGQPIMKETMEERGIYSFAVIPLVVEDEAIGVLALFAREAGFFDDEEMRLLQELAVNISLTIENIEKRERLDYLAYYDPLTGLANRTLFLDRVSQHMRSAVSGGYQLALFLMDLDRFKNINDSLGRAAGDALLKQVADWMARQEGDASLLARVGSNHFGAVMPRVGSTADLVPLIERSLDALGSHPFPVEGAILRVTAKVGVAMFPEDGGSAEALFQNAEAALKHAKASGDRYLCYSSAMTEAAAGKLSLENQLRRALDNEEFVLHYQPKVNLASGKVTGAEALIRWNHPDNGLVPPVKFIPVLEESGLIHEVGRWAMRQAIEDYLRWCDAGLAGVRIAVNVSSLQLRSRGFVAEVAQVLASDPRASSGLELEITESMVMSDIKRGIATLQAIRAMGVTVALDDFGTGFSSLSYLARLPIDALKIDHSFINEMVVTPEGLALVSTIITLAHSLEHKVVAEGVETAEQSRLLRLLDCDEMQGLYFSMPVPSAVFEASYLTPSAK